MNQKLESIIKRGKAVALAGVASLAIGCGSLPPQDIKSKPELTAPAAEKAIINPVFLAGKSLDDRFKEFNGLNSEQQVYLAKSLNNLSVWDTVLLSRYAPIDGILKELSSFYSTDYKEYLQTILSASTLNPMTIGLTGDKGLGQLAQSSEKWARELYNNKKLGYKFPGAEITDNIFDPQTNLVLSSILFRKAAEEKVSDLDALCSLYNSGFKGVTLKEGVYAANEFGLNAVERAKSFDSIADNLMVFSWVSMNKPELSKYIEDANLKRLIEVNNGTYDGKTAYEDMINFLNSISTNSKKYSEENKKMFKNETANISGWIKNLYSK